MSNDPLKIYVIAGEASGDLLGANLLRSIKSMRPNAVFYGIGGEQMEAQGLKSLFPMQELSVMGLTEVLPKLWGIMQRLRRTVDDILRIRPDVVVTIDSPDFCFRVIQRVKEKTRDIPCVHYVAPSVWAWRPGRAKKVAKFLDHILTLLPFEPPYFQEHGLDATFVGHPVVEPNENRGDSLRFRQKYGLSPDQPVLAILPGSRVGEVSKLLEKFAQTAEILLRRKHDLAIVIPTLPYLQSTIDKFFVGKGINPVISTSLADKQDAFAASMVALAASGTVSLQLAVSDTPHVIAYRLNNLTAQLARKFIKTPYVNLVNILQKKEVVPELLQEKCEPEAMAREVIKLMESKDARNAQLLDFRQALLQLGLGDPETPGHKAAAAVLHLAEVRRLLRNPA